MNTTFGLGLFPLSADPITFGHLNIIDQALEHCQHLLVVIGNNDAKTGTYLFSQDERVFMAKKALELAGLSDRTTVIQSELLTVDEFLTNGCDVLFRGIRDDKDREYEEHQIALSALVWPEIADHVMYLQASKEHALISSSNVKAFVSRNVSVEGMVPVFVKELLEERILKQHFLGITGQIGSGKSYVAEHLSETLRTNGHSAKHINLDEIQRELYSEQTLGAQKVRDALAKEFGNDVLTDAGRNVHRTRLAEKIFSDSCSDDTRKKMHALVAPHIMRMLRATLRGFTGFVILEWAQLIENELLGLVNNRIIIVESPDRAEFCKQRGICAERMVMLETVQWNATKKIAEASRIISEKQTGNIIHFINRANNADDISQLANAISETFQRT